MSHPVELINIQKRFGSLLALDHVSLSLKPGQIHGLLGENGAGKSTLMNVLYGMSRADSGSIHIHGKPKIIRNPRQAIAHGIGMVHQHFMLAGQMTVLDNILLGDSRNSFFLDRKKITAKLETLSEDLGLQVSFNCTVNKLSVGQQQRVEILKALYRNVEVLILDEPTAVLTPTEVSQLMKAMLQLRDAGKSIVFISHKLREIKEICDVLTVLRHGKTVFHGDARSVSADEISTHIIGKNVSVPVAATTRTTTHPISSDLQTPALKITNITGGLLKNISFQINGGEILGIAGVDGNGQEELEQAILGLRSDCIGGISFMGNDIESLPTSKRFDLGIGHIPNDRKLMGLAGNMSIFENISLKIPFKSFGIVNWMAARKQARELMATFDIRAQSISIPVSQLSGGNQQKVILARELGLRQPNLVVAVNPVRGLDVSAIGFVREQLLKLKAQNRAVLLICSDLDEIMAVADRIAVLYNGQLTMSNYPNCTQEEIGQLMTGAGHTPSIAP